MDASKQWLVTDALMSIDHHHIYPGDQYTESGQGNKNLIKTKDPSSDTMDLYKWWPKNDDIIW